MNVAGTKINHKLYQIDRCFISGGVNDKENNI